MTSSSVHDIHRHSAGARDHVRRLIGDAEAPRLRSSAGASTAGMDQKGAASMSTQINVLQADAFGALPATLVILMAILAMLGVIANVAMA